MADLAFPVLVADLARLYTLVRFGEMRMMWNEVTTPGTIEIYISSRYGGIVADDYARKLIRSAVS